jgi:L-lactate utilization protein LutB
MQQPEQMSVPVEAVAPVIARQRNEALDRAAQWEACAMQLKAERDQALAELEKLRADAS